MIFGPPGDDDDDGPDGEQLEAFQNEALAAKARWDDSGLEDRLRRLGVYVDQVQIIPMPGPMGVQPGLAVLAQLGAVAFTDRVMDPEKDSIEDQFRVMAMEEQANTFLDTQSEIKRRLAAGESIADIMSDIDEDDDDDTDTDTGE